LYTERLYYDYAAPDPYSAEIREIRLWEDHAAILLDKTIFYPEGGGQEADRGSINGVSLLDVKESSGATAGEEEILHIVSAADAGTLKPGPASLLLDSRRRRDFTVQHSAQHLLSGTILRLTGSCTVSMRLGAETCTIDVDAPELSEDTLARAEDAAADAIETDAPLVIHLCPPEDITKFSLRKIPPQGEDVIRVVEIAGYDFSPCCGTHCRSTAQIGLLRILGAERYKGMTRVTFIAGRRVLAQSRLLWRNGETISRALKVPVMDSGAGVLAFLGRNAAMERELKALQEAAAETKAEALLAKAHSRTDPSSGESRSAKVPLVAETYNASFDEILRIGRAAQKKTAAVLLLASRDEKKFAAFCSDKGRDLRSLLKKALEENGGKGGGGAGFFQGVFETLPALESFLANMI
jgi:alanyl-tRNA synthetase